MQAFKVDYFSTVEETSEVDPEDEWSRASTSTDHTVMGLTILEKDADYSFDVIGNTELKEGETAYLVYAVYSTGDSFGNDAGSGIEFIQVFSTLEKAELCEQQINLYTKIESLLEGAQYSTTEKLMCELEQLSTSVCYPFPYKEDGLDLAKIRETSKMVYFQDERGEVMSICAPWSGHFESLDGIYVSAFTLSCEQNHRKKLKK